jgi:hypothetical protein
VDLPPKFLGSYRKAMRTTPHGNGAQTRHARLNAPFRAVFL